jgi:hypothetical protein
MKQASQQDNASPRTPAATCSRAGTGRRSGVLLSAIKSLAADIAAIKLAVPSVADKEGQQVLQRPGPAHLVRAAAAVEAAQQWEITSESKMAQMRAKSTGVLPFLQQGRRPPMHVPYAPSSLVHVHDMHARPALSSAPLAPPAEPHRATSPGQAESPSSSTSVTPGQGPSTPSPASSTFPLLSATAQPATSHNSHRQDSPVLSPLPLPAPLFTTGIADSVFLPVNETLPMVSNVTYCILFFLADDRDVQGSSSCSTTQL